jgi:hypothetical protein
MAAFARGYKRPTPRRELAEDLSGHKGPIGHCAFVRRRRYELAMITSSRLIGKCSRKPHLRSGFRNLRDTVSENLESCYSIRSTPTKRIRCGHALPETCSRTSSPAPASRVVRRPRASVADRRGRATGHASRGPTSHGRACSPSRARRSGPSVGLAAPAGRERNFSSPQILENKRNRVGTPPNPPGSEDADATSVSPDRKELRHRVRSRRRSLEIGAAADTRLRNFPIRNTLKRLERAKESRRPSLPAWASAP